MTRAAGRFITLPLCPSTNARQIPVVRGRRAFLVNTHETAAYLASVGMFLRALAKSRGWTPIRGYTFVEFWFVLPNRNCDPHNFFKVSCDALEDGGIVENDKYIIPLVRGVAFDEKPSITVGLDVSMRWA